MPRSFKLKMALFSLGTSGAILLAFAGLFMSAIRRTGLERVDRQIQTLAEGQMRRFPGPETERWSRFDDSLSAFSGEDSHRRFILRIVGSNGTALYTSPGWPVSLKAQELIPLIPENIHDSQDFPPPLPPSGLQPEEENEPPALQEPWSLNRPPPPRRPDNERFQNRMRLAPPRFLTVHADGKDWRFISLHNPNHTLLLGSDMAELKDELHRFKVAYALAVPLGLLLLASGGWLLARQALHPVQLLTQVAGNITAKGLDQRVQAEDADQEFQALIDVINGMLNRLEVSFCQAARFSADAAHELKTPLTILQGQLNQALRSAPVGSQEQRNYADLLEEVQRLKAIVRKLLLLAQSDSGQLRLSLNEVSLNEELEALFEDLPLLAPDLVLNKDLTPDIRVQADPDLLRQVLQNLISNAVKYNHEQGTISCQLRRENSRALLSVSNTVSPGATIDRERLFDRFYRGDAAHNRKVDGTGLGLSLAREISRAHGGDLTVEETRDGWISFLLSLPMTPAATSQGGENV